MIKLLSALALAFAIATPAEAITPVTDLTPAVTIHSNGMISKVAWGCGPGRTRVRGVCVRRSTIRRARRCLRWHRGVCVRWF